ncbi:MAG: hypothetical protein J2P50_15495 [Hyphomicrobiaceae bacterium]|nr:hypothetical protein [Hyphomicrobiaceae bacterium]
MTKHLVMQNADLRERVEELEERLKAKEEECILLAASLRRAEQERDELREARRAP